MTLAVLAASGVTACAEPRSIAPAPMGFPSSVSHAQAKQAINEVFERLESQHPAPYKWRSSASVREARRALLPRWSLRRVDAFELATRLELLIASLNDDGTSLTTMARPLNFEVSRASESALFPALVEPLDGGLVVTHGVQGLRAGDRVLRVNEYDIDSLLLALAPRTDGQPVRFPERMGSWLFHSPRNPGFVRPMTIVVRSFDGDLRTITALRLSPGDDWPSTWVSARDAYVRNAPFRWRVANGVLLLTPQLPPNDRSTIAAAVAALADTIQAQQLRALVVDLRDVRWMATELADRLREESRRTGRFGASNVPVCALMNRLTFDAAAQLADDLRTQRLARTIGEETAWRRHSYLSDEGYTIPHLYSQLFLPRAEQPAGAGLDDGVSGVQPQFSVTRTARDVARGRDPALDVALRCGDLAPPN